MCAKAIDDKKLIVIKFNTDAYWCGLGKTDMHLRHALIYTDIKMAREAADGSDADVFINRKYITGIEEIKVDEQ